MAAANWRGGPGRSGSDRCEHHAASAREADAASQQRPDPDPDRGQRSAGQPAGRRPTGPAGQHRDPALRLGRVLGHRAGVRQRQVRERLPELGVVLVDRVAEVVGVAGQLAVDDLQRDVDDVVRQPATVREPVVVATEDAEPVRRSGRPDRLGVEPQLSRSGCTLRLGWLSPGTPVRNTVHEVVAVARSGR